MDWPQRVPIHGLASTSPDTCIGLDESECMDWPRQVRIQEFLQQILIHNEVIVVQTFCSKGQPCFNHHWELKNEKWDSRIFYFKTLGKFCPVSREEICLTTGGINLLF